MSRPIRIAGLASLLLHLLIVAGLLWRFERHPTPAPIAAAPDKPVMVELVIREQKGAGKTSVAPPPQPQAQPQPPQTPPPAPKPPEAAAEPVPSPPEPPPSPPAPPTPPTQAARPAPPKDVPQINIGGTDSPSNTVVIGHDVIPASPDKAARNRPPVYPNEAARLGQQGGVVVVVHVGASGLADGVDIERSSGYALLDRAAENAVRKWAFVPAMKDGLPVPFDFRMNFQFAFQ